MIETYIVHWSNNKRIYIYILYRYVILINVSERKKSIPHSKNQKEHYNGLIVSIHLAFKRKSLHCISEMPVSERKKERGFQHALQVL